MGTPLYLLEHKHSCQQYWRKTYLNLLVLLVFLFDNLLTDCVTCFSSKNVSLHYQKSKLFLFMFFFIRKKNVFHITVKDNISSIVFSWGYQPKFSKLVLIKFVAISGPTFYLKKTLKVPHLEFHNPRTTPSWKIP